MHGFGLFVQCVSPSRYPKKHERSPHIGLDPEFTHHQHIGRVSSNTGLGIEPQVESAYQQWANRKRLEAVEQALQEIQSILSRFEKHSLGVMPDETE